MSEQDNGKLLGDLLAHEERVWQALCDGDAAADSALLAEDFLGVYPDGFATRADHAAQLERGPSIIRFTLSEARALRLGAQHGLLSYRARFLRPGRPAEEEMYVTSVWEQRGAGWINLFSQDTPASGS